jgi:cyanophycin synthetase
VLTVPGDRRDEDLREVGRRCGALDYVILKEDADRRGRTAGEIAGLIGEGLAQAGVAPERIERVFTEAEAVTRGIQLMEHQDLLVVLAADVPAVLSQLGPLRTRGVVSPLPLPGPFSLPANPG